MGKKGCGKFLAGVAIGGALGVLFAPKKGSESRKDLKNKACSMVDNVKNADYKQIKEDIENKIADLKAELSDLDKEKALKITKLKDKADEIVALAVEKGTPVLQKMAKDAKKSAIDIMNKTIAKLENDSKPAPKKTTKTTTKK